jgi:PAS domain S-box-containing protein
MEKPDSASQSPYAAVISKETWASFERIDLSSLFRDLLRTLSSQSAFGDGFRRALGPAPEACAPQLLEMLRQGVAGDWTPIRDELAKLGTALATSGVEYRDLHRLADIARQTVSAELERSYVAFPAQAFAALALLHRAVDRGICTIGEEYLSVRERLVRAQRETVEHALQSSELRFTRLFEAGIIGILICDIDGNIKEANDAFLNMVRYSREDVFSGRVRWADMTPPEWRALDDDAVEQLKARGVTNTWEKEYLRKDGSRVPILVGVAMLSDADCIAFVLDITERRRLEELRARSVELEAQNQRVQESSRLKNEFLANMSHELRTPLNSIIGFADVLYDREVPVDSPKHHELLGDILKSGRHLLQLINDVLDLAKVEAGKLDFRPEPVDLTQLIGEVASVLRTTASTRQLRLITEVDPSVNEVTLDPARLKQVLYNYISNAMKFTDPGGRVTVRARPDGERMFRLEVEDTGIGVAEKDISRLFIEFQQLDAGTAKRHAGTGLGLALTKRIVEAQAGSVGVSSTPNVGSLFYAILPREAEMLPEEPADPAYLETEGSMPVLVIEDDARDRRLLMRILNEAGYGVEAAATGRQAIAACARRTFSAITLDLLLPDLTGLDVLHSIRIEGKNQLTPVVVVSVVAEKGVVGGFPVHDYLKKPVDSHELVESLHRAQVLSEANDRVWVIDDDPAALKLMDTVLSRLGYRVTCQSSAELALRLLEDERPAAIVLDLLMPGIDGFEFLARFRQHSEHHTVPIIIWTMKDLNVDDHKRIHRFAQAVLLKGADRERSLLDEMRTLMQHAMETQHHEA